MSRSRYTHSPRANEFRDVVAIFRDGQTAMYSACVHHADEIIAAEPERLHSAELPVPWLWQVFRSSRGQKVCGLCSQMLSRPASAVEPVGRMPIKGTTTEKRYLS